MTVERRASSTRPIAANVFAAAALATGLLATAASAASLAEVPVAGVRLGQTCDQAAKTFDQMGWNTAGKNTSDGKPSDTPIFTSAGQVVDLTCLELVTGERIVTSVRYSAKSELIDHDDMTARVSARFGPPTREGPDGGQKSIVRMAWGPPDPPGIDVADPTASYRYADKQTKDTPYAHVVTLEGGDDWTNARKTDAAAALKASTKTAF
jgi:hypothetical protein